MPRLANAPQTLARHLRPGGAHRLTHDIALDGNPRNGAIQSRNLIAQHGEVRGGDSGRRNFKLRRRGNEARVDVGPDPPGGQYAPCDREDGNTRPQGTMARLHEHGAIIAKGTTQATADATKLGHLRRFSRYIIKPMLTAIIASQGTP